MPPAVMKGIRATARPRIATTTVPPAKTTARPAVASDRPTASTTSRPSARCSRKPGQHEQRVVDADAQADHRPDHGRPGRDVDDVRHQGQRADADREAEQCGPDRQPHRDHGPERQQQDRRSRRAGRAPRRRRSGACLEREVQVAAGLDPQRRSTRAGRRGAALRFVQVAAGPGPRARGTGPGPARPGRRARRSTRRRPADRRGAPAERCPGTSGARRPAARPRAGVGEASPSRSRGVRTTSAPSPTSVGAGPRQQLGGLRGSPGPAPRTGPPGRVPNAAAEVDDERRRPRPRLPMTSQGRRAAKRPSRSSARDMVVSSMIGRRGARPVPPPSCGRGSRHIGT